jgi:hypothetical protein
MLAFKKSPKFGSRLEAIAEGTTGRAAALNVYLTRKRQHRSAALHNG